MKVRVLVFTMAIALIFASLYTFTLSHEGAHKEIFRLYGVQSTVHVNLFGTSETIPEPSRLTEAQHLSLIESQSLVEAYGYQLLPSTMILTFIASLLFILVAKNLVEGNK